MGAAATVAVSTIFERALYELRDPYGTNYNADGAYGEMLGYLDRCNELIYQMLIDEQSELVRTGTGTFDTVAGTQEYDLSANTMGDFWSPHRIWISEYDPMEMCEEGDLYDAINSNEGSSVSRAQPDEFCIIGDYIWFKDVPDDAYTVNLRYFPNYVGLTATTDTMLFKNLFNNEILEGIKILAKNRNEISVQVDAQLKEIFFYRAMQIIRQRRKKRVRFTVGRH
jgi:hypothetical protein